MQLQKFVVGQYDVLNFFEELLLPLNREEFELFLVQAWFIWSQRNRIAHGGSLQAPAQLNKRAGDFLEEFQQAQEQLIVTNTEERAQTWQPPPASKFKLNFDEAIFADLGCSGVGVIIHDKAIRVKSWEL